MGKSTSTVNQALAAIRTLAREAAEHGLLGAVEACGIERIHGLRSLGRRTGTWLSAASARALLSLPDKNSMQGKRDRCLLALEVGAGVRRAAWSGIQVGQLKRLDDRWVIADMKGK
jgi:site-specific recombinase XerC